MYSYCGNDPINYLDPAGLFWRALFRWIANLFRSARIRAIAKRIAIKFVVRLITSGNLGAAIRGAVGDFSNEIGLALRPRGYLTPAWNPASRHPLNASISTLDRYIIRNLLGNDLQCHLMGIVAALFVKTLIGEFGAEALNADGSFNDKAVSRFDELFSAMYTGRPMNSIGNVSDLNSKDFVKNNALAWTNPALKKYVGQRGFKSEFREGTNDANDQTHHFTVFFSAGINSGIISYGATAVHNFGDNEADQKLGNAAYALGKRLRSNPKLLSDIGSTIQSEFCTP